MLAAERDAVAALENAKQTRGLVTLLVAAALTGLSAGFMYMWNEVNIPGLAVVDDVTYITAMNGFNSVIRNLPFGVAFFGSIVALGAATVFSRALSPRARLWIYAALALYLTSLVLTFTIHVPMNRDLLELTDLSGLDVADIRETYETRWNTWHLPRAYAHLLSFLAVLAAVYTQSTATEH